MKVILGNREMDRDISRYLVEKLSHRLGRLFVMKFIDPNHEFDGLYYDFRKFDGRIYSDEQLSVLPNYNGPNKKLVKEWKGRKHAADMMIDHIKKKFTGKTNILDLGCGVGWLTNQLSELPDSSVYAVDIVQEELVQAAKVFDKPNVQFIYGNIYRGILPENSFNVVVLSGCIEFFPNLKTLFENAFKVLKKGGEVHIINSPIYKPEQVEKQEEKMNKFFEDSGFALMKRHYFYHTDKELEEYKAELKYNPDTFGGKLSRKFLSSADSPHSWYVLRKDEQS